MLKVQEHPEGLSFLPCFTSLIAPEQLEEIMQHQQEHSVTAQCEPRPLTTLVIK